MPPSSQWAPTTEDMSQDRNIILINMARRAADKLTQVMMEVGIFKCPRENTAGSVTEMWNEHTCSLFTTRISFGDDKSELGVLRISCEAYKMTYEPTRAVCKSGCSQAEPQGLYNRMRCFVGTHHRYNDYFTQSQYVFTPQPRLHMNHLRFRSEEIADKLGTWAWIAPENILALWWIIYRCTLDRYITRGYFGFIIICRHILRGSPALGMGKKQSRFTNPAMLWKVKIRD